MAQWGFLITFNLVVIALPNYQTLATRGPEAMAWPAQAAPLNCQTACAIKNKITNGIFPSKNY